MAGSDAAPSRRETKVERLVREYDLEGLPGELEERWTATGERRHSLRDLATYVNRQVLESTLAEAGIEALDGEVENYYRLLTDDDVSAGRRTETRARLEREGVDVDDLKRDFVSHQAVHTFLTDRQDVAYEGRDAEDRLDSARDTMNRLEGRIESVGANTLERLTRTDDLDVGDASVLVSVDIVCNDCGSQYDFETLLERGGCACSEEP